MGAEMTQQIVGTPAAEVEITVQLVHELLLAQHPYLAGLPLHVVEAGWDNAMFRLGEDLCVRLPRRQVAAALIEHEQIWLPQVAERLPLPVPMPYRVGYPALGYPWRWSVLPWLPGVSADGKAPRAEEAKRFAAFLRALHVAAPDDAPVNAARGVPLQQRAAITEERMARVAAQTDLITREIRAVWEAALEAPKATTTKWLHGDLHARNVLVEDGVITGIIDWGDITSGDVATDLASIWALFDERKAREHVCQEYAMDEATLQRAKGWAVFFGVVLVDTGLVDHPRHAAMGEHTLRRVAADADL